MEITFNTPKEVVTTKEVKNTFASITVASVTDRPSRKLVTANTLEGFTITLWEGDAYDAIGQWTDADVVNRINELYL